MLSPRTSATLALAFALASASCRSCSSGSDGAADASAAAESADSGDAGAPETDDEGTGEGEGIAGDASNRFRDAEPKVEVDKDGPIDPACAGAEIAFATAIVDARCAIGSGRAKQLRAILERDAGALPLKQEAKLAGEGRVTVRLVNTGRASLTLPLSFAAKLPAFTALAEDDRHTLYELEAPRFEPGGLAAAAGERPHFARIVLAPGGAAVATVVIDAAVVRRLGRPPPGCADASRPEGGPCAPPVRLPKGRYVLHVGELLTDVEVGAPAHVTWDVP